MRLRARLRDRSERGAALVEFVFVAPMFMLLLTSAVQVGIAVVASASGTNAAREAARTATVRYECADNHISTRCPIAPSTNYNAIKAAAVAKLGGLVPSSSLTISVVCRRGSVTGIQVLCEKDIVKPDTDVVVVTTNWQNFSASRFVPFVAHSTQVVMSVVGRPDLASLAPEPDIYPPAVATSGGCVAKDNNADGVIDRIQLTFDEDIVQSVSSSVFSLANSVTGSNTIVSASVAGRVVTLTLGGTTVNTGVGSMLLSISASASGVRDSYGNQASLTCAPTDGAAPKLVSITDTNGLINGKMEVGDTLTMTFSEPIGIGLGVTTVTESDPNGGANDSVTISGITALDALTNSDSYITTNNSSAIFTAVAAAVGNTVVVTLGAPNCGLCTNLGTGNDATAFSITVSTSLGDASGNQATGTGTISNIF